MSLCINKKDLQSLQSNINSIEKLEPSDANNSNKFTKKTVDSFCDSDNECSTGFCGTPENCESVFKDPSMCQRVKVCKTTNNISQTTNFNLKHN
tara:strand:+ start:940 stop:1221 length:282 start_codon:yes stop_codon:yes gene_type:complete